MIYYTTFENLEHAAIHMYLEILPKRPESLRDFAVGAAKIVELLTGDTGLVKMAETLPGVDF